MSDWPVLRTFDADHLRDIAMPIGGIGTGFFCLGGGAQLIDWQLMSRPNRGWKPMYAHFVAWSKAGGEAPKIRILEDQIRTNLSTDFGEPATLSGLPRMRAEKFEGSFPFGRVTLTDPDFPLHIEVEGFSPLIPRNAADSSLPFGVLTVTFKNASNKPQETSLTYLATNFIGCDGHVYELKDNVTEEIASGGWKGMNWTKATTARTAQNGSMALLFDQSEVHVARRWVFRDRAWNGETLGIMDELLEKGFINDDTPGEPCPPSPKDTWDSSISAMVKLAPGESKSVRMLVAWHFPLRNLSEEGWWSGPKGSDPAVGNHYVLPFKDAAEVATRVIPRLDDLRAKTVSFVKKVIAHPAPEPLREAALFNLSVLKSHTCFRLADGTFAAYEGCGGGNGCCTGSCTHVWNYEAATVDLFPELHRSMLDSHFGFSMTPEGGQRFRLSLPVANPTWGGAAADGQMGMIIRCYHQYTIDQDKAWLTGIWPKVKSAIAFAWQPGGWDGDQDGVMEGVQHNTYDVEFFGPNAMMTGWYCAALAAGAKMATIVGDKEFAAKCDDLRHKGGEWVDRHLYNGQFYIQHVGKAPATPAPMTALSDEYKSEHPRFQMGAACHSDMLLGQYKGGRCGLGDVFDRYHMIEAAKSIYKFNFKENFHAHYNNMRSYALGDDQGTLICSYPEGQRPAFPFPYWSECWTGIEYALAAVMIDLGLRKEGVKVASAAKARHDGKKRNPFNEPECGSYYARSMSSWSLLHAWAPDAPRF